MVFSTLSPRASPVHDKGAGPKSLRIENEYFQKQLDTLRRDAENAKMREKEAREAFERESFAREAL